MVFRPKNIFLSHSKPSQLDKLYFTWSVSKTKLQWHSVSGVYSDFKKLHGLVFNIHLRDGYFQDETVKCGKSREFKSFPAQCWLFNTAALLLWQWIPRTTDGPILKLTKETKYIWFFKNYLPLITSTSLFPLIFWMTVPPPSSWKGPFIHHRGGGCPPPSTHHKLSAKRTLRVSRFQSPSNSPSLDSGAKLTTLLSWD